MRNTTLINKVKKFYLLKHGSSLREYYALAQINIPEAQQFLF